MDKVTRNTCKFCRYLKCKDTGMVSKWVLSAYKINSEDQENKSIKCNEQKGRSNSQEDNLAQMTKWAKINIPKYDSHETQILVEEINRKDTLSSDIDKKVLDFKYGIL